MSACENCWRDASLASAIDGTAQIDAYHRILGERTAAGNYCHAREAASAPVPHRWLRDGLTDQQTRFLDWLIGHFHATIVPPTIREMQKAMRFRSPRSVQQFLAVLRREGWVAPVRRRHRAVVPMWCLWCEEKKTTPEPFCHGCLRKRPQRSASSPSVTTSLSTSLSYA